MPTSNLAEILKLSRVDGHYEDVNGNLTCFDPSIYEKGTCSFLIRKEYLLKVLEANNISIMWIINQRKTISVETNQKPVRMEHELDTIISMNSKGEFWHIESRGILKSSKKS